ncbi:hypothetical protein ACFLVF_03350, partial [Chloroflexota bacterium]
MGIRRKNISDRLVKKVRGLLAAGYQPKDVHKQLMGMRDQLSISSIYNIRSGKKGKVDIPRRGLPQTTQQTAIRLERQQMEHMQSLQKLARSIIDSIPESADVDDLEKLDSVILSLWQVFKRLTGDP